MTIQSHIISSSTSATMLPQEIEDRSAWYRATDDTDWVEEISADQICEVESAVRELERSRVEIEEITVKRIPLPTLAPWLKTILDEVLNGTETGLTG